MRRLGLGSSLLLGLLVVGCGSDPGSIAVSWRIGLSGSCDEAGITTIRITLEEEGGSILGPFEAGCEAGEDGSTFKIADVDEGSYTIKLQGLNSDGGITYTGESTGRTSVSAGKTSTPQPVPLSPAPASMTIQWRFNDGLGCPAQDGAPDEVVVILFKDDSEEANISEDCVTSLVVIPDLGRSENYDIQVTAVNGATPLFRFSQEDVTLADGEQKTITGEFVPCADIAGNCN